MPKTRVDTTKTRSKTSKTPVPQDVLAIRGGQPAIQSPIPWTGYSAEMTGKEEERYVLQALRTKRLDRNEYHPDEESFCTRVEMGLEKLLGVKHVYLLASASIATQVSLMAMGVGPGDEVIFPAIEYHTIPNAVISVGAVPIIAQSDETKLLDVADVERVITPRTKAIVVAHLAGSPVNMDPLMKLAKKHNLFVIEDTAQAVGGSYKGRMLGSIGDVGVFSLHSAKLIGSGAGGFISTNRDDIYEFVIAYMDGLVVPGRKSHLNPRTLPSLSSRMNEVTAAIVYAQLERLPSVLKALRGARDAVVNGVKDCKRFKVVKPWDPEGDCGFQIILKFNSEKEAVGFEEALTAEGVQMCYTNKTDEFKGCAEYKPLIESLKHRKALLSRRPMNAAYWPAMQEKVPLVPHLNPWTHPAYVKKGGSVEYHGMDDIKPTIDAISRLLFLRMNPRMEPKHGEQIAAAIRKVDSLL